jgi:hypothetical protein
VIATQQYGERTAINTLEVFLSRRAEELGKTPRIIKEQCYDYYVERTNLPKDQTNILIDDQIAENQILLIYDYKVSTDAPITRIVTEANEETIISTTERYHEYGSPVLIEPGRHFRLKESHTTASYDFKIKAHATIYTVRWD